MSAEEQEMMAKISQLAGRINRYKNEQAGVAPLPPQRPAVQRGGYNPGFHRGAPYPTKYRAPHRHRTLVLNGANSANKSNDIESDATSDNSTSPWVLRNDRHRQLINSSVYEKDSKARTRAIEQTRLQTRAARDMRERAKLMGHLKRITDTRGSANIQGPYELTIDGVRFVVAKNGSKLIKAPGDTNSAKATPKMAVVGGVKFYRSKNGNLYRHGIVKAQRRTGTVKKVDVPCKEFSTTGSCRKGPQCRYLHDPSRVAVCKDFLQKGQCVNGDACDLSHDLTPERTPTCLHFAKDHCTNPNCRYAHAKVSPGAPVCRAFGIFGYCEKGAECPERHAFECPDFSNTGVCRTKGCKLLHRERASVLRKNVAAREKTSDQDEEMEDLSSDDDGDSIDSDDVDSDEVEEFIGEEDGMDFEQQKDFIHF